MTAFPPSSEEEERARKLVTRAAVGGCVLVVAAWFAFPWFVGGNDQSAKPSTASPDVHAPATNAGNTAPTQTEAAKPNTAAKPNPAGGETAKQIPAGKEAAKQNPEGEEHASGGRASASKGTSAPINITDAQRATLRSIFASGSPPRVERPNFEVMIGASVAEQTPLADLPPEVPKVLNGFSGDKYVIAGDELVIVDQHSRRVAAFIGDVK
jgi:hypothetical protein